MRSLPTLTLTAATAAVLAMAPTAMAAPADDAVGYLAAQLEAGGDRLTVESGGQTFDDLGLTIDALLAMTAQGSGGAATSAATDYVVANAGSYIGTDGEIYSAAHGKLLTLISARALDPRDVGGTDLVAQQQSLEADNGQFVDRSEWGDYSNTIGQSFGIIGLERAGTNPSTASVDFLLSQQCGDGGFSLDFTDGCVSDPDATSFAVQALEAVGDQDDAVQDAADFLEGRQDGSGGVGGGVTTEAANANSTGLAVVAFRIAGRDDARAAGVRYLDSLTLGCSTPALTGAIAYNTTDFDAAVAQGSSATPDGTLTRSTAQAMLGRTDRSYVTADAGTQSSQTPTADCGTPNPTPAPTPAPTPGDDGSGEPGDGTTPSPGAPGAPGAPGGPQEPEIPAVVQTDGVGIARVDAAALGSAAALAGAALVLAARRRASERV